MMPSDLYFFFETESLANASPMFLSQVGIVVTQDSDISWKDLHKRHLWIFLERHQFLLDEEPNEKYLAKEFSLIEKDFLMPFI